MATYLTEIVSMFTTDLGLEGMAGVSMVISLVGFLAHRLAKAGR
jgi:hypothetical protein